MINTDCVKVFELNQLWNQVSDQVEWKVSGKVRDQVWLQVRYKVWDQVQFWVRFKVKYQVWHD